MKFLLLALLALAPFTALANDELHCRDVKMGGDQGYFADVKELREAQISEETFAGRKDVEFGKLECTVPHNICRPDKECMIALCASKGVSDDGYLLYIKRNGEIHTADLAKVTKAGNKQIAKLNCKR